MPHILFVFASAATAEYRVAGIPAAARAAHALASLGQDDGIDQCTIVAGTSWTPSADVQAECRRLAAHLPLTFGAEPPTADVWIVRGEAFIATLAQREGEQWRKIVLPALFDASANDGVAPSPEREEIALEKLRRASRLVLAATGKSGDGIVSRYINRPISRAISYQLLRVPGLTPSHASMGTALLGIAMAFALFLGDAIGLIAGAVLFQAASIFDGVDGEMARATYRTSEQGATLDSIIDACTNLAFVTGVTVNVGLSGDTYGAFAGVIALVTLTSGLLLIGRRADAIGEPTNFDVIKRHFREKERRSLLMESLIHLTMRDFFALACAVMILAGLTQWLLFAFAGVASAWLLVSAIVLLRTAKPVARCSDSRGRSISKALARKHRTSLR